MSFKVAHFLVLFVVVSVGFSLWIHFIFHSKISFAVGALAFFLPLNSLICYWEIGLGLNISHIKSEYLSFQTKYGAKRLDAVLDFFLAPITVADIFSLRYWSRVWSTYSLYDPSYSNRESFGFFVDVGNGWTTLIPSLLFLVGMTFEVVDARTLGIIGFAKFYQELYGTCIYFLSYILNKRYVGCGRVEVALFVGLSNGLWFFFPMIGMWASAQLIYRGDYSVFR